jgi:hypothetical protein
VLDIRILNCRKAMGYGCDDQQDGKEKEIEKRRK